MIEFLLGADPVPGTNLRTDLSATNWLYLMPSLDVRSAIVLGDVPGPLVDVLERLSDPVTVGQPGGPSASQPELVVVGAGWTEAVPAAPAVFRVGRAAAGAARLCVDGPPTTGVASLAVPIGKAPSSGASALLTRAGRMARRAAVRAGAARMAQDGAERTSTLAVRAGGMPPRRAAGTLIVADADLSALPAYVVDVASSACVEIEGRPWRVLVDGHYPSQKVVFFIDGADDEERLVVKVAREPAFTPRLDNEHEVLSLLARSTAGPMVPAPRFRGRHAGLSIVGESWVAGSPFSSAAIWRPDDPLAGRALDLLLMLGEQPLRGTAPPAELAGSIGELLRRYVDAYRPEPAVGSFLGGLVAGLAAQPLPTVVQHGDPGTWNMLVHDGGVRLLDWENSEPRGVPLWDISFFVQAYALRAAERRGIRPSPRAFARLLLGDSEWSRWHSEMLHEAADAFGVPSGSIAPLFVLGWVYQAVKEIPRLAANGLHRGRSHRMLCECVRAWDGPGLRRLRSPRGR